MSDFSCGLAADTKVETPEGAMAVRTLVDKNISVFTREPSGRVRFRRTLGVRRIAQAAPVLRVTLVTGESFRVAPSQVLYNTEMGELRAAELHPGTLLLPAFHYRQGYVYRDDETGGTVTSDRALRVRCVEPAGTADIYSFGVARTGNFVLSAGVVCKAEHS